MNKRLHNYTIQMWKGKEDYRSNSMNVISGNQKEASAGDFFFKYGIVSV